MGKVDGVLSGTYQGLAGAFTGLYDGTVGLVREPILGHRQEVSHGCNTADHLNVNGVADVPGIQRGHEGYWPRL